MRWDWDSDQLGNVIRSKANLFSLSFLPNNSQPLATPQIPVMQPTLCLFLWISGVLCLEKFEGPLFQATCEAFSCELMACGSEKNNGAMPVNTLLPTNLTTSTILYCKQNEPCFPCIRVQLTVSLAESRWNLGGSGSISERSKDFDTDEGSRDEDYDEDFGLIDVSSHQPESGVNSCVQLKIQFPRTDHGYNRSSRSRPTGTVELSCFQASMKSEVLIKAFTKPENQKDLQHTHKVEDCTLKDFLENIEWCKVPSLNVTLENKIQIAIVNVPQDCYTRFKYDVTPEFESKNPLDTDKLKVTEVRRNFSDIVPCLCMEVWSATMGDARRRKECPFSEAEGFRGNIWKLSSLAAEFKGNALQWTFSSPCNMLGEISLCSKSGDDALCHEIPHSRQNIQINKLSEYSSVDPHPSLCIKIISGEHVNFSCPFDAEVSLLWKVESKVMQSDVTVTILHTISKMNFSICTVKGGKCEHFLHNIKEINQQMKQLDLGSQDCFQVWRSDVNFSPRVTVCPFDMYTRARWTPLLVLFLILAIIVIVTIIIKKQLLKGCIEVIKWDYSATAPTAAGSPINRKVLLLYSLDHNQFEKLVNTFAYLLFELNFQVAVDLWNRREMGAKGPLPWIHSQKNKIAEEGGKILILFSKGAGMKCNEWLQSSGGTETIHDPYDGFMASLNCVLPDIIKGNVSGKYVVAYFEDLQNKAEIPEIFNKMPIYNLPSQLTEFLQEIGAPANYKPVQKATSCQSTISDRLNGVIKECQLWEQNHSTWYQDHYELEGTSEGQEESDAMMHCSLIKMEMLSMV